MKLLFCRFCEDVFKLPTGLYRSCACGKTRGRYVDDVNAVYSGDHAVPLGFANESFAKAVMLRPAAGQGLRFDAFVIAVECGTFKKE